jgi:hypothetical protein
MRAIFILTIMEYTVRHYLEYAATAKVEADSKEEALKKAACIIDDLELEDLEFIQTTDVEVFNNDGEYYCETY